MEAGEDTEEALTLDSQSTRAIGIFLAPNLRILICTRFGPVQGMSQAILLAE
jgi:hypothetical protein